MADNFDGQVNVSGNQSNNINSGIFSTIQHKQTQQQLNQTIFGNNGLSQVVQQEAKVMIKAMEDMLKTNDKLKKSQQTTLNNIIRDSKNSLAEISKISSINETSLTKFENVTKNTYNNTLKYYELQQKILQDELTLLEQKKRKSDEDKARIIEIREEYDQIANSMILARDTLDQTVDKLDEAGNTLKSTTKSWSEGMSETLDSVSSTLGSLANMFNINKLANSGLNQFVSTKLDLQNQMMKDFGMTSKNEYLDFKNNLDDTLNSMGNLFNSSDLKTYMGNLSKMGITDTDLAESMAKSSMLASKYLGVSTETQQQLFKYMKRTNDYDMLDEHNKTITGILQAQLGVSREQLDSLTAIAYGNDTTLASLGMNEKTLNAINEAEVTNLSALVSSGLSEDVAQSINELYSNFLAMDTVERAKFSQYLGPNADMIYQTGWTDQTIEGQAQNMLNFIEALQNSNLLNMGGSGEDYALIQKQIQGVLGQIDTNALAGLRTYLDLGTYGKELTNILENRDMANPETFVENTTELTTVDKIANTLDKFVNDLPWEDMTGIVIASAGLQIASGIFSSAANIKYLFSGTKALSGLTGSSGGLTKLAGLSSKFLAGGIAVGLTTAAISGLAKATSEAVINPGDVTGGEKNYYVNKLKSSSTSNDLSSNSAYQDVYAAAEKNAKGGFFTSLGGATANFFTGAINKFNKNSNPEKYNSENWTNFMKVARGMQDASALLDLTYAYAIMLNEAGMSDLSNSLLKISKNDIKTYMNNTMNSDSLIKNALKYYKNNIGYGVYLPVDYEGNPIDLNNISLDGYHKAGKNYIPKDNYHALLHKGEMVLDSEAADAYRKGFGIGGYDAVPWPITSRYNSNSSIRSGYHTGTDFGAASGTPVGAAIGGTILNKSWGNAWGNHVIIHGDNGLYYLYAHFSKKAVNSGKVNTGQTIGYVGSTGNSTGPHLHFEVQKTSSWARGNEVDPGPYVTSGLLGDSSAIQVSSPVNNSDSSFDIASSNNGTSSRPIISKRILPGAALSSNGVGGADLISSSVDSGINKIINYLNTVRNEQDTQREMLNTFSKANTVSSISG